MSGHENGNMEDRNEPRRLSCTSPLVFVRVPVCKRIRVRSTHVPDPQAGVGELLSKRSMFSKAARRGGYAFLQKNEAAAFVKFAYEFDVLEDGKVGIAAQFLEYGTPDEATAVPETEEGRTQVREPGVKMKQWSILVEPELKGAAFECRVGQRFLHLFEAVGGQERVGMQKQQNISSGLCSACVHLPGSPSWRLDDSSVPAGDSCRFIEGAAVRDNDFVPGRLPAYRSQGVFDARGFIQCGNDHGDERLHFTR